MKELQIKNIAAQIESKSEGEDGKVHIKFYALAFGNIDSWGDIIEDVACDKFLASEEAKRIKFCYQHKFSEVIGVVTSMQKDSYGLLCEADILPTTTGKDVQILVKEGAINEFSIGYYADEYTYEEREGYDHEIRVLKAITIIEVSPVTRAANPRAILLDAKSEEFQEGIKGMTFQQLEDAKKAINDEMMARLAQNL